MEALFQYFVKVNGLLVVFYLAYYLFLRKETFFQSNRWFLLLGIASSFIFPLISFTNVIWIEPEPFVQSTTFYTPTTSFDVEPIPETFNWNIVLFASYILVSLFFLTRLTIEIISFFKIIKSGNKLKTDNIVLVETNENQNPFSFFNYLVFNKSNFTEEELGLILIHEKVHIQQKHSVDVLVVKLLCLVFWANPIIWFYRKAMLENLEYIADHQTTKITNQAYQYQKTLLKVVVCNSQLSITNQFYQSLIKKRIVMLNTNPSNNKKLWKYSLVVPFLVAFVMLFQIETIAQVKEKTVTANADTFSSEYSSTITSKSTDEELKALEKTFSDEKSILKISKVKRNKANEIIAIKLSFDTGKTSNTIFERASSKPIKDIKIVVETDEKNIKIVGFIEHPDVPSPIIEEHITINNLEIDTQKDEFWSLDNMTQNGKEVVLIINGKVKGATEKVKLPLNEELGEMKEISAEQFEKKYNSKADKNKYYYEIQTVKIDSNHELPEPPSPPSPPSNPYEKLKEVPGNFDIQDKNNRSDNQLYGNYKIPRDANQLESIKNYRKVNYKTALIIFDSKEISLDEFNKLDSKNISSSNIMISTEQNVKQFGSKAKEGIIFIRSKDLEGHTDIERKIKNEEKIIKIREAQQNMSIEIERLHKKVTEIVTENGNHSILFDHNQLKIPGLPTITLYENTPEIIVNGKKLQNAQAFINMDHSKIYYLDALEKIKGENGTLKVLKLEVKTK